MDALLYALTVAWLLYLVTHSDEWIDGLGRAVKLRTYREFRQWRDALHRAEDADDDDEVDRLCRIGVKRYAIERANGGTV